MTHGKKDQDHLEVIMYSKPSIPDRTNYLLGSSDENPVYPMIKAGKALELLSVDYIAIPCITAHYFYKELAAKLQPTIIHGVRETALYLKNYGAYKVGLMATEGTISTYLFQNILQEYGIETITPGTYQQRCINHIIYQNVKANKAVDMDKFYMVADNLRAQGAQIIILACSELSMLKRYYNMGPGFLDTMEVLAMRSLTLCNIKLKEEYKSLVTKEKIPRSVLCKKMF